jgi:glycosyl transferase family 25
MVRAFHPTGIRLVRVPAVDGASMQTQSDGFDPAGYRRLHGREINLFEVACYFSHIKALRAFLDNGDDDAALILEDDVTPLPSMDAAIQDALRYLPTWSIIRLSGLSDGSPLRVEPLSGAHALCINLGRLKGAGAYMITRAAARQMVDHLLPVTLPYDHAMDREWLWNLKAACILPFPISQTGALFRSSIQHNSKPKLGNAIRFCGTYPYQAFNEVNRFFFRLRAFAAWQVFRFS